MKVILRRPFYDRNGAYWPKGEIDFTGPLGELPSTAEYAGKAAVDVEEAEEVEDGEKGEDETSNSDPDQTTLDL